MHEIPCISSKELSAVAVTATADTHDAFASIAVKTTSLSQRVMDMAKDDLDTNPSRSLQQGSVACKKPQRGKGTKRVHSVQRIGSKKRNIAFSGCACRRSHCIKLYCECFRRNLICSRECKCSGCENIFNNIRRTQALASYPTGAFNKTYTSCNCKESECRKNYCVCFASGRGCGPQCSCRKTAVCLNPYET